MKTWHVVAGALVGILAFLLLNEYAGATASGTGGHWYRPTTAPAQVHVIDNLPPDWHPYVLTAAAEWSAANNLDLDVLPPQPCTTAQQQASPYFLGIAGMLPTVLDQNIICIELHTPAYDNGGGLWGYTYFPEFNYTPENGSIMRAVEIWIDSSRIGPDRDDASQWVITHELGHALGLGHRPQADGSVMYQWWAGLMHPLADDLQMIDAQTTVYVQPKTRCKGRKCK